MSVIFMCCETESIKWLAWNRKIQHVHKTNYLVLLYFTFLQMYKLYSSNERVFLIDEFKAEGTEARGKYFIIFLEGLKKTA